MALKKQDRVFVNDRVPSKILDVFKAQNQKLLSGERKRATLPNMENDFHPLDGLESRLNNIHNSQVMKHAVEYCDRED